jgi:hypothetical protein
MRKDRREGQAVERLTRSAVTAVPDGGRWGGWFSGRRDDGQRVSKLAELLVSMLSEQRTSCLS